MITCSACRRVNEDHYKFCLGCGASLESQRAPAAPAPAANPVCPQCGAVTSAGQRFCGSCGFDLAQPASVPRMAAPVPSPAPASQPFVPAPPAAVPAPQPFVPAPHVPAPVPMPAPAPPSVPSAGVLIFINPDGSPGDMFDLHQGDNTIGRATPAEVFSRDPYLSPHHVKFQVAAGSARISDLNSLNGVFVRITEVTELSHGDYLRIGREVLRFEVLDAVAPVIAAPADGTHVAGSNPMGAWGRLERISAPGVASLTFMLRGKEMFIGRERGDILFRDDGYVSGRHARVFTDGAKYFVEDLKSSNGTFVRIRTETTVPSGTLILLGQQPFRLQLTA